jgi:hypothetical protein
MAVMLLAGLKSPQARVLPIMFQTKRVWWPAWLQSAGQMLQMKRGTVQMPRDTPATRAPMPAPASTSLG